MLVPCGRQPKAISTPFAFSEPAGEAGVVLRHRLRVAGRDGGDLRVRVAEQDLHQLDGRVPGAPEDRDFHLVIRHSSFVLRHSPAVVFRPGTPIRLTYPPYPMPARRQSTEGRMTNDE
jgi:hypothetical protein